MSCGGLRQQRVFFLIFLNGLHTVTVQLKEYRASGVPKNPNQELTHTLGITVARSCEGAAAILFACAITQVLLVLYVDRRAQSFIMGLVGYTASDGAFSHCLFHPTPGALT